MSEKHKLWGGVFREGPDELAWGFGQSISTDRILWKEELEVSIAHAEMLGKTGIVSPDNAELIIGALAQLSDNDAWLDRHDDAEDIHAAVEAELVGMIGEPAKNLTAARSRNDQVATTSRIWTSRRLLEIAHLIDELQRTILELARTHKSDLMLGMTHMQAAQPITLGFHLMAYFWMLDRDKHSAIESAAHAMRFCPLGSCAIAGTALPVDREYTAKKLGFHSASPSAIDSVSDRDFIGDALHSAAKIMQHLSRLSSEMILWSTPQFGYVRIADAFSTGSSLMPQKRNPDMAELIRGRAGQAIGAYASFMSMMKGQPLAYNRDMQDDKPSLFTTVKVTAESLEIARRMLATASFDTEKMAADAGKAGSTATGIAEFLTGSGKPFREAHETAGRLVRAVEEKGWLISGLTADQFRELGIDDLSDILSPSGSVESRKSYGGPSPKALEEQIRSAESTLDP